VARSPYSALFGMRRPSARLFVPHADSHPSPVHDRRGDCRDLRDRDVPATAQEVFPNIRYCRVDARARADPRMFYDRSHVERSSYCRRGIRRGCRPPHARAQCNRRPEVAHASDDRRMSFTRRDPCGPSFEATPGLLGSHYWGPSVYPHLPLTCAFRRIPLVAVMASAGGRAREILLDDVSV
jgi:hypothetical protein